MVKYDAFGNRYNAQMISVCQILLIELRKKLDQNITKEIYTKQTTNNDNRHCLHNTYHISTKYKIQILSPNIEPKY